MSASFLDTITAEYIRSISNNSVYSRGLSYRRNGRVHNLSYNNGELAAEVEGSETAPYSVFIFSDEEEIYEMNCECLYASDGETCKHVVATLLEWIEQRGKEKRCKPLSLRQKTLFNTDNIFTRFLPFSSYEPGPANILSEIFSDFDHFNIKVDLLNGGPQLEIKLVSPHGGDETVFHISAKKKSKHFWKINEIHRQQGRIIRTGKKSQAL